jgi:hypothetical protein
MIVIKTIMKKSLTIPPISTKQTTTFYLKLLNHSLTLLLYCPCLCCHSLLWCCMVFLSWCQSMQGFFSIWLLYCHWISNYEEGEDWNQIFVPVPKPGLRFPMPLLKIEISLIDHYCYTLCQNEIKFKLQQHEIK